ncbi:MAG: glycosyltransferase [Candidatus Woesebacteria bacterium]|jgi:glycosyltransferase involved in cell wall biosynthesis
MNKNKKLLSVIIPAFKQEKIICQDLNRILKILKNIRYDFEVICVVDGRVDQTYQQAKKIKSSKVKVVAYKKNKGKGYAVRYGLSKAKGQLIAFLDAGMDIDPHGLPMLLEHMLWYDSDVIVGSIRHSASKVSNYPLKRKILSFGYHTLTRILFGLKITDCQRGLKIFKRKTLEKVLPRLLVKKFAFDIEVLAVMRHLGFKRIHDGPVEMDASKMQYSSITAATIASMLLDTLAVFYRLYILRYYDDSNKRKWRYDPDLNFKVNVG